MIIKPIFSNTSLQNNMGDESGISPSRFPHTDYLENEDPNDTLRNPNRTNAQAAFSPN